MIELPEPAFRRLSDLQSGIDHYYTTTQMHDYAARVCAEKDEKVLIQKSAIGNLHTECDALRNHIHTCGPTCTKAGCVNTRLRAAARMAVDSYDRNEFDNWDDAMEALRKEIK
jgi:hypothetical protein